LDLGETEGFGVHPAQSASPCSLRIDGFAGRIRRDYNEARPHSALEYLAPAVFAARWRENPETMNRNSHTNWINEWGLANPFSCFSINQAAIPLDFIKSAGIICFSLPHGRYE